VITTPAFRTYAQAAPDSKPPVALYGLDGTYASSLVGHQLPKFLALHPGQWDVRAEG